jgi:hypothetical protein
LDPLGSILRAVNTSKPEVIVPCDDAAVQHLHELHTRLAASNDQIERSIAHLVERSLGAPDHYPTTAARYELLHLALELGLPVPETASIRGPDELDAFRQHHAFPWVLKVDGTWGGSGIKIVENITQAKEELRKMSAPLGITAALKRLVVNRDPYWLRPWYRRSRPSVIVQKHIAGRPANSAIVTTNGKTLAGVALEVVGALSMTGCSSVVRIIDNRQMMETSERLADTLKLSGFHGFDFMIENRTGIPYLIEMNPRVTPICHLQLGRGKDMVGAFGATISGHQPNLRPQATSRQTIAYFPKAWHWNPKSELLRTSFHDVPWEEPALLADLIRLPWPDRSFLAHLYNRVRHQTFEERAVNSVLFDRTGSLAEAEILQCRQAYETTAQAQDFQEEPHPSMRASY